MVRRSASAEKDHFGDYLRELHGDEMKAKKLLKRDRFQRPNVLSQSHLTIALQWPIRCCGKGRRRKGQPTNNPTFLEIVAFSRKVLEFVHAVLDLAAGFSVQVFASVVDQVLRNRSRGVFAKITSIFSSGTSTSWRRCLHGIAG